MAKHTVRYDIRLLLDNDVVVKVPKEQFTIEENDKELSIKIKPRIRGTVKKATITLDFDLIPPMNVDIGEELLLVIPKR